MKIDIYPHILPKRFAERIFSLPATGLNMQKRFREVREGGGLVEGAGGSERLVAAETVILAIPRKPRQQLLIDLEFFCDELYIIGDAVKPRSMHNAVREGYLIGIRI